MMGPGRKPMSTGQAVVISMLLSLVIGALAVGFPFLFAYAACSTVLGWFGLCSGQSIIMAFVIALAIFTVIGTIAGVVTFLIIRAVLKVVPKPVLLVILILLFVAGLLIIQPELDVVALLGLIFTFAAGTTTLPARRRGSAGASYTFWLVVPTLAVIFILVGLLYIGTAVALAIGVVSASCSSPPCSTGLAAQIVDSVGGSTNAFIAGLVMLALGVGLSFFASTMRMLSHRGNRTHTFAGLMLQVVGVFTVLGAIGYLILSVGTAFLGPGGLLASFILVVFFVIALGVGLGFWFLGQMLKAKRTM
jgi:hypothetical protein